MPIYHLRRTATFAEFYTVQAATQDAAIGTAMEYEPDLVEDMGDGEWDVYGVEADPEPEPATEVDARILALRARALDIVDNEADLVHDDDSGGRSAEVKRLVRALNVHPDGRVLGRLISTFPNEADEVFGETEDDRAYFGDPVPYAIRLLPVDYYSAPEGTR